jgi:hypothetical protein
MKEKKILSKVISGQHDNNIKFQDLRKLLLNYDFSERIRGDHYIFTKEHIYEIINLQPLKDGKAKQYQVKQVRDLFFKYKIHVVRD